MIQVWKFKKTTTAYSFLVNKMIQRVKIQEDYNCLFILSKQNDTAEKEPAKYIVKKKQPNTL
jgi:hypothetical protein